MQYILCKKHNCYTYKPTFCPFSCLALQSYCVRWVLFPLCRLTCPRPSVLSKSAEHLLLSCQDPVPKVLPQLRDSLFCLFSSATSMQTSIVLAMHSSCASFCSLFFFDKLGASLKQGPRPVSHSIPRPLTPGIVLRACYLMIALLLILATSWEEKIYLKR